MSDTVLGWLFGGWQFGKQSGANDRTNAPRVSASLEHAREHVHEHAHAENTDTRAVVDGIISPEFLAAVRTGDRDAFATLYRSTFRSLWVTAVMRVHSEAVAEDLVQDVFLWLWTHLDTIVPERDIRAYLTTAVQMRSLNVQKHARVHDAVFHAVEETRLDLPGLGQSPPTDRAAESAEFRTAYTAALAVLTDRERIAARLRWEEEMTFQDIGDVLGLTKKGAQKMVMRAQAKVQAGLAAYRGTQT